MVLKNGRSGWFAAALMMMLGAPMVLAQDKTAPAAKKDEKVVVEGKPAASETGPAPDSTTDGVVTAGGQAIAYKAVAGTITVGSTDGQDITLDYAGRLLPDSGVKPLDKDKPEDEPATAR